MATTPEVEVLSVPWLLTTGTPAEKHHRRAVIEGITAITDPGPLALRIPTTTDPLVLWALHLKLDRLGIPPCQRWPANRDTRQAEFITFLADLKWLHKRLSPGHRAEYRGWRDLLAALAAPEANPAVDWHDHAHRQYLYSKNRRGDAWGHWAARGLALSDELRQDTMTMPTASMRNARRHLQPSAATDARQALLAYAIAHPDLSGKLRPDEVADRHFRLWRCWLLAGKSPSRCVTHWGALTGECITRQRVTALAEPADLIVKSWPNPPPPPRTHRRKVKT